MKSKRIIDALGQVNEIYIEEAANVTPALKKRHWARWGALAACLCLVVGGVFLFTNPANSSASYDSFPNEVIVSEDGVTIPPTKATLGKEDGVEYCWAYAFFIYQGRCYKSYDGVYGDSDLIGEYLGTARGMIDVWTPKEGYVELAGNIKGDFYSVKGYDPEFMVCMRSNSGAVEIFINDNNLTLKYGSDLLENRFHLSGNLNELVYQNHNSWDYSTGEIYSLNNDEAVSNFITLLNQGTFIPETQALLPDGANYLSQAALYHIDLRMYDGTTIELTLVEGGYIEFGIYFPEVCLKVDEATFNELIALLDSGAYAAHPAEMYGAYRSIDECLADPLFGSCIPAYVPEGMSYERGAIYYNIEPKTGNILQTREVNLTYSSGRDPDTGSTESEYYITIASVEDYGEIGWTGTLLTPEEVTLGTISQLVNTSQGSRLSYTSFGVQHDDVMVILGAYGLDAAEAYRIMSSINN